jgi:hypothetical protein
MSALAVGDIPVGPEWQYEPKWDGFRCLAFRDGDDVYLQSKAGQPLARYALAGDAGALHRVRPPRRGEWSVAAYASAPGAALLLEKFAARHWRGAEQVAQESRVSPLSLL